jgi:fructokinase
MIPVCGEELFDVFLDKDRGASQPFDARPGGSPFNVAVGLAPARAECRVPR